MSFRMYSGAGRVFFGIITAISVLFNLSFTQPCSQGSIFGGSSLLQFSQMQAWKYALLTFSLKASKVGGRDIHGLW